MSVEETTAEAVDLTPAVRSPRCNRDFYIDLIDKCNLQCPTCFRGTGAQKNTSAALPLPKFREIVRKARREGYSNIGLINWTEAFLLTSLDQYVRVIKEFDLDCWVSSNLSLPPDRYLPSIISALESGIDILFVSVSGWTQAVYEINHKKGRVDWIRTNIAGIARQLRSGRIQTSVWIRYLEWPYNSHEKEPWQTLAEEYKIGFEAVPAHDDPFHPIASGNEYINYVSQLLQTTEAPSPLLQVPEKACVLIMDRAALDSKGDAYLCCAYPNLPELRIGAYVEMGEEEFLLRRHLHPFCRACQAGTSRGLLPEPPTRTTTEQDRERFSRAMRAQQLHAS